ncbi:UbiH/UbiF/VisC/COQ6 family ubiquinone biosynthesis hydroxylase [Kushneria indalinina]|uniref:2-octaprenylphenol hydroxylase n=1 Tax=Kushneria indalinina DSM 14324 TaxID=1122140 RepID=A0A3D9DSK7_9GAMM|nr:UbiH/UbiF/VisC/COQ6 family ubiquinone biosynthesis hydroxylase [Kushneria indalinina]REC93748.1 2-octaprenylphenol hydroxylase [Kushneria indalinina DSM 14324]
MKLDTAQFDMAIVGAGLVGATLALALGQQGHSVALLDGGDLQAGWQAAHIDARVSAITPASRQFLTTLGVWPGIASRRLSPYGRMAVWDGEGTGRIDFSAAEVGCEVLGHIIENGVVRDALLEAIAGCKNVTLMPRARVTALSEAEQQRRCLTLQDGRTLAADLVIGADGARSQIRELAGLGHREYATGQRAVVATVWHERDHEATARQRFMGTGPLAFLPLSIEGRQKTSSIVWSADTVLADELMDMTDDAFIRALGWGFEHQLGRIEGVSQRHDFPLVQRHARRYVDDSVALVGDAAHNIHPLAGQGVNLGLMDAAVLAEELGRAGRRGAPVADVRILSRYARRRRGDNTVMLMTMDAFRIGFGTSWPLVRVLRNQGLTATGRWPWARRLLIEQAMGQRHDLPDSMRAPTV